MRLILARRYLTQIETQAIAALPSEACGLLSGTERDGAFAVERLWPAFNLLSHELGRFELDPRVRFLAEKTCREQGRRVLGHWHSHPQGPPQPSATDLAHAYEPDMVWLIAAVEGNVLGDIRAFLPLHPLGLGFQPVTLEIVEEE